MKDACTSNAKRTDSPFGTTKAEDKSFDTVGEGYDSCSSGCLFLKMKQLRVNLIPR